jgi:hypothetical protein
VVGADSLEGDLRQRPSRGDALEVRLLGAGGDGDVDELVDVRSHHNSQMHLPLNLAGGVLRLADVLASVVFLGGADGQHTSQRIRGESTNTHIEKMRFSFGDKTRLFH